MKKAATEQRQPYTTASLRYLGVTLAAALIALPGVAWASGDGHGMNWTQFAGSVVNLVILLILLVKFGGPKIKAYLATRKETVEEEIVQAESLLDEARARLEEVQKRADGLDAEIEALKASLVAQGEAEAKRIVEAAESEAERIIRDARRAAENEARQAQIAIRDEVLEKAITKAEETLVAQMNVQKQMALVDQYIENLGAADAA